MAAKMGKVLDKDEIIKNNKNEDDEVDFLKFIDKTTDSGSAAFFTTATLLGLFSIDPTVNVRRIEQAGPVMYIQAIITMNNVNVENIDYDKYYMKETFLVNRDKDMLIISTLVPTPNPLVQSGAFAAVNEWLTSFRRVKL
jgi:hypothetical protein